MSELAKSNTGSIQLIDQLTELNKHFTEIKEVMERDRASIEGHIEMMKGGLKQVREFAHMSEEASLEKQINEAYKQLNLCNRRIDTIIDAVTKIVTAKIVAEGSGDGGGLKRPIDIASAKK